MNSWDRLKATVVDGGYCIGCGVCAATVASPLRLSFDDSGFLRPTLAADDGRVDDDAILEVCPFSGVGPDEDAISDELFAREAPHRHPLIGRYRACFAGHVTEGEFRARGSSGGMGTWLPVELLREGLVDAVVHVKESGAAAGGGLFEFAVSRSPQEVMDRAKSAYYPVEMSGVLRVMRERPGRYALIGVPCFVKAVRLLARKDETIRERVRFAIGLVCGHLKSSRYADYLAWQTGIEPGSLTKADFRVKRDGATANRYSMAFEGRSSSGQAVSRTAPAGDFFAASWGYGLFMYGACDVCDDVVAETADMTIGDAWLPAYIGDWRGSNLVITRNEELGELLERARREGRLALAELGPEDAVASQGGGFRHRREGLSYRLSRLDEAGGWRPPKRVQSSRDHLSPRLRAKYDVRARISALSHRAFAEAVRVGDFEVFRDLLRPLLAEYDRVDRPAMARFLTALKAWARASPGLGWLARLHDALRLAAARRRVRGES